MFIVGLTGGIGSGKSTVAHLFAERGAAVVDADEVAREVVAPGSPALQRLVDVWGTGLLTPEGSLDRRRLRTIVFGDPQARQRLEGILHPLIRQRLRERLHAHMTAPYGIAVVPLLLESGWQADVDRILVVDAPEQRQVERAVLRDGVSEPEVRAIMATQWGRPARLAAADDVIDNSGGRDAVLAEVERLHTLYCRLAAGTSPG